MDSVRSTELLDIPSSRRALPPGLAGAEPTTELLRRPAQGAAQDTPRSYAPPAPHAPPQAWSLARTALPLLALAALVAVTSAGVARFAAEVWNEREEAAASQDPAPRQRWFTGEVVVTLDESLDALGPQAEDALRAAFLAWQGTDAQLPVVRFVRGKGARPSLTPDGENSVLVAPIDFDGHETDLAITIGFSHPRTGEITEADIVINSRHVFSILEQPTSVTTTEAAALVPPRANAALRPLSCLGDANGAACGQTYDLQNVLTHEVGHFWGLPEDFEDRGSTMYSCTSACEVHKRQLAHADIQALQVLYGTAPPGGCGGARFSRAPTGSSLGTAAVATALGVVGLLWGGRRRRRARTAQPGTSTRHPRGGKRSSSD
ncbi:MAG: matrixin family metalloprotease [Myxococcales bacterium]|nr:matrixin family metalloprotease [Myxococcales bacterium]